MQVPPPFTPLSIARDKDLIHTPSIHSSLSLWVFTVYCSVPSSTARLCIWLRHVSAVSVRWSWSCTGLSGRAGWMEQGNDWDKSRNGELKMRGCNRRKESSRLFTVLISRWKKVTVMRRREGRREGERFSVLGWWSTLRRWWLQLLIRPGLPLVSDLHVQWHCMTIKYYCISSLPITSPPPFIPVQTAVKQLSGERWPELIPELYANPLIDRRWVKTYQCVIKIQRTYFTKS